MKEKELIDTLFNYVVAIDNKEKDSEEIFNSYCYELINETMDFTINLLVEQEEEIEMIGEYSLENRSKIITTVEIEQILNLLHNEYNNLGSDIKVYSNYFQLIRGIFQDKQRTFRKIRRSIRDTKDFIKLGGYYDPTLNRVVVLEHLFFLLPKNMKKLYFVSILLHELRHNWQHKHQKFQSSDRSIPYNRRIEERDANLFSMRMMNKYKTQINEILNLGNLDWEAAYKKIKIKNS